MRATEWTEHRDAALKYAGYRCQVCNSDTNPQVHHRTYARYGNERPEDLTVLCGYCHVRFSRRRDKKVGEMPDCAEFRKHNRHLLLAVWRQISELPDEDD